MSLSMIEHTIRIVTVTLQERVDTFSAPALREQLHKLIDEGANRLVIDLQMVPFFDSAALAVLVSALKRARQKGGDVKLVWPQSTAAQRIFRLTKFDRVFEILDSVEEARQAFGG